MRTYSSYLTDIPRIINNSLPDNITWGIEVINDSLRYLTTRYYFNERTYTTPSIAQTQFYNQPAQIKKLINVTVTIGSVVWQPRECPSREYWDALNTITFYQDFPSFFFVYNSQVGIYPIPASSGNLITMHYKTRIPDLSQADYVTGTVAIANNTTTVTGSGTVFTKAMIDGGWIRLSHSATDAANGDGQWYQIASLTSTTSLELKNLYTGDSVMGATYTLGQVPILPEDYQDLPLYRMAILYYTTRFPDPVRAQTYQEMWDKGLAALDDEYGSKSTNVTLADTDTPWVNPNLFQRHVS